MIVWVCNADDAGVAEITVHSSEARAIDEALRFVSANWDKVDGARSRPTRWQQSPGSTKSAARGRIVG
jgi:hypothetical protein